MHEQNIRQSSEAISTLVLLKLATCTLKMLQFLNIYFRSSNVKKKLENFTQLNNDEHRKLSKANNEKCIPNPIPSKIKALSTSFSIATTLNFW